MFQKDSGYNKIVFFAVIVFLSIAAYSNSLQNSFHYDDFHSIVENYFIRNINAVPDFFTSKKFFSGTLSHTGSYRPILLTTYAVNYYFGKLEPFGYHLVNLIIHLLMSLMVFLLAKHFFKDDLKSFWAALLFALNPFNSEVVNYISSRSSSLSALFFMFAFYCYVLFRQKKGFSRLKYCFYLFFFGLALLSKISAVMLPAVVVIYDLLFIRGKVGIKELVLPHSPFILGTLVILANPSIDNPVGRLLFELKGDVFYPAMTAAVIFFEYLRLFFFPVGLMLDRNVMVDSENLSTVTLPVVVIIILLVLLFRYRSNKKLLFIFSWFFITLFPMLCMPLVFTTSLFQDSRGYLSSVVLAFLFSMALSRLSVKKQVIVAVPLMLLLIAGTYSRNMVWVDEFSLWTDVAAKDDSSYMAHHSLGVEYGEAGEYNKAIGEYKLALELEPTYYLSYQNLSKMYFETGNIEKALEHNSFVLKLKKNYDKAHYSRGYMMMMQGNYEEAITSFKQAIRYNPNNLKSYLSLGFIYQGRRMFDEAVENYLTLLKYDSGEIEAINNLGLVYLQQGKQDKAEEYLLKSLSINPDFINSRMNLAGLYRNQQKYDAAIAEYDKVLIIDKDFVEAYFFKGIVLQAKGNFKEAVENFKISVKQATVKNDPQRYQRLINDARQRVVLLTQMLTVPQKVKKLDKSYKIEPLN